MILVTEGGKVVPLPGTRTEARGLLDRKQKTLQRFAEAGYFPHAGQLAFHLSNKKRRVASAGRRGGKTKAGAEQCANFSHPVYGREELSNAGVILPIDERETLISAIAVPEKRNHRAALRKFLDALRNRNLMPNRDFTYNKSQDIVEIYTDGMNSNVFMQVQYKAVADDPDKMQSEGYVWVWFDEAGSLPKSDVWYVTLPALADYNGVAIFTTSPGREESNLWLYDLFIDKSKQDYEAGAYEWMTEDNIYIPKSFIDESRRTMPKNVFDREFRGKWEIGKGLVLQPSWLRYYKHEQGMRDNESELHLTSSGEIDKSRYYFHIGIDPAISVNVKTGTNPDFTAAAVIAKDKETGIGYLVDLRRERISAPDQVDLIQELYLKYEPLTIGIESVAYQQSLAQFAMTIPGMRPGVIQPIVMSGRKEARIPSLGPIMKSGTIRVNDRLPAVDSEGRPVWEAFFDEWKNFPKGQHDDTLDAVDIAIRTSGVFNTPMVFQDEEEEQSQDFNPRALTKEMLSWSPDDEAEEDDFAGFYDY